MNGPRARHFIPLFAFAGAVAAAVACYGPTEVVVDLSTDLDCTASIRTAVYKGEPFRATPETETTSCTPGADTSEIGTLTVLPSGSDDGDAAIKAVLAIGGKDPTTCDADPTNCIVATRSFSFVAHSTRRVPIILSQECLGTKCPEGQTCGAGGACIANTVTCGAGACSLPGESDGGAGRKKGDGGGLEAGGPDAGAVCGDFGAPPVLAGIQSPVLSTATADTIYFATRGGGASAGAGTVYAVAKSAAGAPSRTTVTTVAGAIGIIGSQGTTLAVGYTGPNGPYVRIKALSGAEPEKDVKLPSPALAFGRDGGNELLIATAGGILALGPSDVVPTIVSGHDVRAFVSTFDAQSRVAAVYALEADGGLAYYADAGLGSEPKIILPTAPPSSLLRSFEAFAYAAVPPPTLPIPGSSPGFFQIDGGAPLKIGGISGAVSPFAVDGTYVYGVPDGVSLRRYDLTGASIPLDKAAAPIVHIFVDNLCAYYWTDDPSNGSALYVRPKSK